MSAVPSSKTPTLFVLELAFLVVFWSWVAVALLFLRNTVLPRMPLVHTPADCHLLSETVRFEATDGLGLEGWKIAGEPSRPWIILCHGLGSNRSDLLDIAAGLHAAGFNLFLFDFRGHGGSGGRTSSFGWQEQRDLEGALAFLSRQPDVPPQPYGLYGISMGAAVALMVAGRDDRIGAVAAEGPYTNLAESISRHLRLMSPWLFTAPFHWLVFATYRIRFGVWPGRISPEESLNRLSPRPLFLIQGAEDPRMPLAWTRRMFTKAREPKTLWVIQGAGHLEGFALEPSAYLTRLAQFFDSSLP